MNKQLFESKYQINNESFAEMADRVAFTKEQAKAIENLEFCPAGRQLSARGTNTIRTLFNCYALSLTDTNNKGVDSRVAINNLEALADETSARGGGIGVNWSALRPRKAAIDSLNGYSSGAVSFMDRFSYGQAKITRGGSRRGALIGILDMWHPDIEEFISCKESLDKMNNINISPLVSNDFMEAVKNDTDWNLIFPDYSKVTKETYNRKWDGNIENWINEDLPVKIYKTIKAKNLFHKICENAWKTGEPGLLFKDNINDVLNYKSETIINTVNPCGEMTLPKNTACNLGSINLGQMLDNNNVNWEKLENTIRLGLEYLDKSIDEEKYFNELIKKNQKFYRLTGLGIMGYADMLIKLGLVYGDEKALEFTEKLAAFILDKAYYYDALLAKEKGKAPVFEKNELNPYYLNKCSKKTQETVKKYGLRNGTLLSVAPNGSISMLYGVNGGLEPYFMFEYKRNDMLGERIIKAEIVKHAPNKECLISSQEISAEKHVLTQAVWQKYIDNSLSKTINLPNKATVEDVKKAYILAWNKGLKGVTVYRDGSRKGVLSKIEKPETHLGELFSKMGNKVIKEGVKVPEKAPMIQSKVKSNSGKKYYFLTGFVSNKMMRPFELFILTNSQESSEVTNNLITKTTQFLVEKGVKIELIDNLTKSYKGQSNVNKVARLISMCLRHNVQIVDLVKLMNPFTESISSLIFHIKRHLLNYVEKGTSARENCPECDTEMVYESGCAVCKSCGFSYCG